MPPSPSAGHFTRRDLLSAVGRCLPLPFLPSLLGCEGDAGADAALGHPLVVVRAASGVAQADGEEPERWWPRETGPLRAEDLAVTNADRAVSELANHAEDLLLVRGTYLPFPPSRESHAGGGNQLLTAAAVGPPTETVMTYALGESIDTWIARQHSQNGGEPLTLYAGRRDNYGEEVLSYRGPLQLRGAESDPWSAYLRLIGADGDSSVRGAVNELVLTQLSDLQRNPRLSTMDRQHLELHTDSIRDFALLQGSLSADIQAAMKAASGRSAQDDWSLPVARLHCDLIALVLRCGHARAITLQIGDRLDNARYEVDGQRLPSFHNISHRVLESGELGSYGSAQEMHLAINRLHLGVFRYLLERLAESGLLQRSVCVFASDVSTGSHRYDQMPWILAGRGDGTLRQGAYIDAGGVPHNRVLAALLTATGHRAADGGPITHFGDESVPGGLIDDMLA